jgi:hypothetical protein
MKYDKRMYERLTSVRTIRDRGSYVAKDYVIYYLQWPWNKGIMRNKERKKERKKEKETNVRIHGEPIVHSTLLLTGDTSTPPRMESKVSVVPSYFGSKQICL